MVELHLYAPSSTEPWRVMPIEARIERAVGFPAQLAATFRTSWELFENEHDPANPLQRGGYAELHDPRGPQSGTPAPEFRGKIARVVRELAGGEPSVTLTGFDKLAVLAETRALSPVTGEAIWSLNTASVQLTAQTLHAAHDYGEGFRHVWYPDPSSAAWLSTGVSSVTSIGQSMTAGTPASGSRLRMEQAHNGLPPAGFISVGSEWIEYNGYILDPADGYWYCHNIRRGALGTTAASHAQFDTAYSRLCKRIDRRGPTRIEGNNAGTWELIKSRNQVRPNYESGAFAFSAAPPSLMAGGSYSAIRSGYWIHDEEDAGALRLGQVLEDVLTADPATGAPGLGGAWTDSCLLDIDAALYDVRISRVNVREPTSALDFVRGLLRDTGLMRGTPDDAVALYYNSPTDTLRIAYVAQGSPSRSYYGEQSRAEEVSSERVKSAIEVTYETGDGFNLIGTHRLWHTVSNLATGGAVPFPKQKFGGTWAVPVTLQPGAWNVSQSASIGGPTTVNLVTDNDEQSGIGLFWDTLPAAGVRFYAWFPGATETAPDLFIVRKVIAVFDVEGLVVGASGGYPNFGVELLAYETFSGSQSTTPPTPGTAQPLSAALAVEYTPGTLGAGATARLEADNLNVPARALGIMFHGYIDHAPTGSGRYAAKLLELYVEGVQLRTEFVTLSGTYVSTDTATLVAQESAAKLLDVRQGQFSYDKLRIGPATREVARNMGMLALLSALAESVSRSYTISSDSIDREGLAQLTETARMSDGFTGVVDTCDVLYRGGQAVLNVRLINYADPALVGSVRTSALPAPRNPQLRRSAEILKATSPVGRFTDS